MLDEFTLQHSSVPDDDDTLTQRSPIIPKEYPHLVITNTKLPKYVFQRLKDMMNIPGGIAQDISIYLELNNKQSKIGNIAGKQVGSVIEIIGLDNLQGMLDENTLLQGQNLYILDY